MGYAQNALGLRIHGDITAVDGPIDVATAWHSLEHFPESALVSLMEALRARVPAGGCVIVSVPSAASFQYRIFRRRFAFFDVPAHRHQFTPDSLARLFRAHGFSPAGRVVSWPYNIFGYIQGLLNCALPVHNHLYYRLKRGRPRRSLTHGLADLCLLPVAVPLGVLLGVLDAAVPSRQAVLTCCFERRM